MRFKYGAAAPAQLTFYIERCNLYLLLIYMVCQVFCNYAIIVNSAVIDLGCKNTGWSMRIQDGQRTDGSSNLFYFLVSIHMFSFIYLTELEEIVLATEKSKICSLYWNVKESQNSFGLESDSWQLTNSKIIGVLFFLIYYLDGWFKLSLIYRVQ